MIGLFFYVNGEFLFHYVDLDRGEVYGDFIVYDRSHMEIWDEYYISKYGVDFDYYPRGRIVYRCSDKAYIVYYDRCLEEVLTELIDIIGVSKVVADTDEHYVCHMCNKEYVI